MTNPLHPELAALFYTTAEAAEAADIQPRMMARHCQNDKSLGAFKVGGGWLIPIENFDNWKPRTAGRPKLERTEEK